MGKREKLLAYISEIEAEEKTAKIYGDDWKRRDWKTRQSIKAGELCLAVGTLTQAETKAKRRPGSIGARKAKQKARETRRELKRLEAILAESFSDYKVTTPQYITAPASSHDPGGNLHGIARKDYKGESYRVY